jgi:PhnB protein
MQVQPYLMFDGRCQEAVEFYRKALGAEVQMLMLAKDTPDPAACPIPADKVAHACLRIGDTLIMASDGAGKSSFQGFSLSIAVPEEKKAKELFASLADGGQVQMPLAKTFFASSFGMVADRFGVSWMIVAGALQPGELQQNKEKAHA